MHAEFGNGLVTAQPNAAATELPAEPAAIAQTAANRLAGLVKPDGSFLYQYHADHYIERPGYNILRHAGSIWSLAEAARYLPLGRHVGDAARRGLFWLVEHRLLPAATGVICVVEDGEIKLGGSALAILAILSYLDAGWPCLAEDATRLEEVADGLCAYLLSQVTVDGDFVHKRDAASFAIEPFRSEYYTGEALFALLTALRRQPDRTPLEAARDLLHGLIGRDYGVAQQSHWMMYAAETAWTSRPEDALLAYMDKVVDNILDVPLYRARHCSTPIACRSEALLCALRTWRCAGLDGRPRFAHVLREIEINLSLQIMDYLPDGAFRRGVGRQTVQIDYIQHNLSAFLGYSQLQSQRHQPVEAHG
jgi:hypothetical protein